MGMIKADEEVLFCPVFKAPCRRCPMWTELSDWSGCSLAEAPKWVYDMVRDAAEALDKLLKLGRWK